MTTLVGRTALVTGAASGIGAATARVLASAGARVLCADLDEAGARRVAAELATTPPAAGLALDVRREADWEAAFTEASRGDASVSLLVHCAGISAASPIADTSLADWRRVLETNLDGAFLAIKHGIRAMRASGGAIVVIGSASGIRPAAGAAAYSASKAGLGMLVRTAAKECRDGGLKIRINAVSPAGVKTPMWTSMPFFQDLVREHGSEEAAFAALAGAGGAFAEPEDVANVVAFLVSDAAGRITGVELPVDSGYVL